MNWLALIIWVSIIFNKALACSRIPFGTTAAKSPVDDDYALVIGGNPQSYVPGQKYNVSLIAYGGSTFVSFILALESANENADPADMDAIGTFEITDLAETRFSPRCPNLVENTNTNVKTRVDVTWVAPSISGSGCVLLRATVVQHRDVWFMDDGFLTKNICEEEIDDIDTQPSITEPCCACDEAKYELTFEGKWSRHTHPKDFPANSWRTRFSDIIGASHTVDYRFWTYGKLASEGLKEVAEHGSTRTLESELKDQSDQIRTIIKARGISCRNVTSKTFAVFRVDSKHHLISLVSMVYPSPDWIVGVSGLELCLPNCSWVENKIHNLYPWDAGTDSGPSYMSADQPQVPPDVIRRIKSNFPNDPRSPFYDPSGVPMKPLATLHINRRRLYEKTCVPADDEPKGCETTLWKRWSECSKKCGHGKQFHTREFQNPALAAQSRCKTELRQERNCTGKKCDSLSGDNATDGESQVDRPANMGLHPECAVSEWGPWSSCSVTCGVGFKVQTRHYLNRKAKKKCQQISYVNLQIKETCQRNDCGGDIEIGKGKGSGDGDANIEDKENNEMAFDGTKSLYGIKEYEGFKKFQSYSQKKEDYIPPVCGFTQWSDVSPCIGPCGSPGQQQRIRKVWNYNEVYGVVDPDSDGTDPCQNVTREQFFNCTNPDCDTIVPPYCYESLQISPCRDSDVMNFWFYDHVSDQCALFSADKCDKNRNKFTSQELCEKTCREPRHKADIQQEALGLVHQRVDCVVSEWQTHSCNVTCGEGMQIKTRKVLRTPRYGGKPCPRQLVRLEKCYQRCDDMYSVATDTNWNDRYSVHSHLHPYSQSPSLSQTQTQTHSHSNFHSRNGSDRDECLYSEWSAWTPCTASCGDNSVRQKTRSVLNTELSYKCKDRVRIEKCNMMPCLLNSNDEEDRW